jgi:5-methylcytosine-specific restriction endonuclease McrA
MYIPVKRKIITKQCEVCGSDFEAKKCGANTKRFCSSKCRSINHKNLTQSKKECVKCGELFLSNHNARKYCSDECSKASSSSSYYLILKRDKFKCIYCGKTSIEDGVKLHLDHVHPKSKGGQDIAENLVTSCKQCNISKQDTDLDDDTLKMVLRYISSANERSQIPDKKPIKL